jgi:hypothetical protein
VSNQAPVIVNFTASENENGTYTFRGQVDDESAPGLVVRFGGLRALNGVTATVDATGWFEVTVRVAPGVSGTVTAQTTDWFGVDSNTAWVFIRSGVDP